ncbi:unnamed protein product [Blepharisma stoltei]|uniref:Tetratricopeptide repeat protein n=1 Tax=Blepharisma stoltei TaxID=1481888 RepID=A0AAU9IHH9_9CILI|nr:unnamed protein product [Blepharisma stoltei]
MDIKKCFEPACQQETEYLCRCTSHETYWCQIHLEKHCKMTNIIHPFDTIALELVDRSKTAVLELLEQEKSVRGETRNKLIVAYNHDKRLQESLNYFNKAIEINPNCALYYKNMGFAMKELGRLEDAKRCFANAIKAGSRYDSAYNGMGDILWNEKRYEEAYNYYNWAASINPNSSLYWRNAGDALKQLNRKQESKQYINRAISIEKARKK